MLERLSEGRDPSLFDFDFAQFATLVNEQFPDLRETAVAALEGVRATAVVPEHTMRYERFLECLGAGRAPAPGRGNAFARLSSTVRSFHGRAEGLPRAAMKPDQIVWARSPVRLDLAGGWTDTPPYCFEEGGAVLNVAVNLNGQAPVQVFVRPSRDPVIRLNSIDLGVSEIVTTFEELEAYCDLSSAFSLPRAALCLLGFHPGFGASQPTLQAALEAFGGGLDISLLCAVPKGSGLGTSSILAATLIQGLASACGLPWDRLDVYRKVLALEQMLTSGGGWQDQAGVLFPGLKLIETEPGHAQVPIVRSLPDALLGAAMSERRLLLYYTGVTRLAKNILQDIVDHMILRESSTRRLLGDIRGNALRMFDVLQRSDEPGLIRCLRRSWALNRALDADTTSPAINDMIDRCGTDLAACKLLGAGGGGYLLLLAHEVAGGRRLRRALDDNPPNDRARFVDVSISHRGTQVTHS